MAEGPMLVGRSYGGGLTSVRWAEWLSDSPNNDRARDVLESVERIETNEEDDQDA